MISTCHLSPTPHIIYLWGHFDPIKLKTTICCCYCKQIFFKFPYISGVTSKKNLKSIGIILVFSIMCSQRFFYKSAR